MKAEEILRLLPAVYQQQAIEGQPLMALIMLMSWFHEPEEEIVEELDQYFSPYHTPTNFLPYLGSWFLLDQYYSYTDQGEKICFPTGSGRLRQLIEHYAKIAQWRGTSKGLIMMLELATGMNGFHIEEQLHNTEGVAKLFHIQVIAPIESKHLKNLLNKIITNEKSAFVTYDLIFR
ncbi:MAG: Unknown protein [uncultured Thiotrichaceae bacterium]|uniref:DUF2313 domain-containing protein n=1 Tax=uncultured Thiotrichaceae bacterium TaxID=298394 RepID=A0A6S6SG02_9GAMM|nr:MAG: Unknown protein [uncultured Thiotrichaceae bacterium]